MASMARSPGVLELHISSLYPLFSLIHTHCVLWAQNPYFNMHSRRFYAASANPGLMSGSHYSGKGAWEL